MTTVATHLPYLQKLEAAAVDQCGGVRPSSQQIAELLSFLQTNYTNCVLMDLVSGEAAVCISAAKLGIAKKTIAINARASSKVLAQSEGVFGRNCEFCDVEDLLTAPPALLLQNPHLLAEKMKSANVIFCCAAPVILKRLVPLMAALINDDDSKVLVTMTHHLHEKHGVEGSFNDIPNTDLRVYDKIALDEADRTPTESKTFEPAMSDWLPPLPEPCDPDDIDKEFARGSIKHAMPPASSESPHS